MAAALVHLLQVQRMANNAARRVTGMNVIAHTGAPAHREMEHATSTQHVHVSRETRRRPCPLTKSACLSHVHWASTLLPFSVSSCAVERALGGPEARRDTSGLPSVAITKSVRLLRGDTGEGASDEPDTNRTPPTAWARPTATPTHGDVGFTLPPTTVYRYRIPMFHVKPAVGFCLARSLRIRASTS